MTDLIRPQKPQRPRFESGTQEYSEIPVSSVTRMSPGQIEEVREETASASGPEDLGWYKEAKRPIAVIKADLAKRIPAKYVERLKDKGNVLYIPWYHAISLLDRCTGGHWDFHIKNMWTTSKRIFVVVELTIHAAEGNFTMAATGSELLEREVFNKETKQIEIKELAYGDPSSNAESMALRRAAAKFGLARYLYND